jgi:hypothetical protein
MRLPHLSTGVEREGVRHREAKEGVLPSGCNPFICGGKVIACAAACLSGVGTVGCIACLGSAYDSCKDCF